MDGQGALCAFFSMVGWRDSDVGAVTTRASNYNDLALSLSPRRKVSVVP